MIENVQWLWIINESAHDIRRPPLGEHVLFSCPPSLLCTYSAQICLLYIVINQKTLLCLTFQGFFCYHSFLVLSSHRCKNADKRGNLRLIWGAAGSRDTYLCLSLNLPYPQFPHTPSPHPSTCVAHTRANQLHSSMFQKHQHNTWFTAVRCCNLETFTWTCSSPMI